MPLDAVSEVLTTPIGPVTVAVTFDGLAGVAFGDITDGANSAASVEDERAQLLTDLSEQMAEYFVGSRSVFDIPLDWSATSGWQSTVLRTLSDRVGHGQTIGYQQLAAAAGRPDAARAVGRVLASNPIPIMVPCHRVIAADGTIGGFAGSGGALVELKRRLLELEGSVPPTLF